MIDIETTGIQKETHELLEVGIVEMIPTHHGFWKPGRTFHKLQHTGRQPDSQFARENMSELYARCNDTPPVLKESFRAEMIEFFEECGAIEPAQRIICGWNASNFDIPFLEHHGYLVKPGYETDSDTGADYEVGDYNYRIYEMGGALHFVSNLEIFDATDDDNRKAYFEGITHHDPLFIQLPEGKEHDAIWDCYNQIKILNGLLYDIGRGYRTGMGALGVTTLYNAIDQERKKISTEFFKTQAYLEKEGECSGACSH